MSRRPEWLRESIWKQLTDGERDGIFALVVGEREALARLEKAQADVATHRRLARKFADQARSLLESVRDKADSHGSPPSVVRRVEQLADELASTADSAAPRTALPDVSSPDGADRAVAAYTPPVSSGMTEPPPVRGAAELPGKEPEPYEGPEDMDEDDREPTQVGALARVRSNVKREHTLPPESLRRDTVQSYDGELEVIEDVDEI